MPLTFTSLTLAGTITSRPDGLCSTPVTSTCCGGFTPMFVFGKLTKIPAVLSWIAKPWSK